MIVLGADDDGAVDVVAADVGADAADKGFGSVSVLVMYSADAYTAGRYLGPGTESGMILERWWWVNSHSREVVDFHVDVVSHVD